MPRTHHIESAAELDPGMVRGLLLRRRHGRRSTPDDQIDEVVQRLERM